MNTTFVNSITVHLEDVLLLTLSTLEILHRRHALKAKGIILKQLK